MIILSAITTNVDAYEINYEVTGMQLESTPVVCVIDPQLDHLLPDKYRERILKETKRAINDWNIALQTKLPGDDVWKIEYHTISPTDPNNAFLDCGNVIIYFEPYPSPKSDEFLKSLAKTEYDEELDKYFITVYYLEPTVCNFSSYRYNTPEVQWLSECYGNELILSSGYHISKKVLPGKDYVQRIPSEINSGLIKKTDLLLSSSVYKLVLHEFGHVLGLGHYQKLDDDGISIPVWYGYGKPPSLMLEVNPQNIGELEITDLDIDKIYSIYGDGGFQTNVNSSDLIIKNNTNSGTYELTNKILKNTPVVCSLETFAESKSEQKTNKSNLHDSAQSIKAIQQLLNEHSNSELWNIKFEHFDASIYPLKTDMNLDEGFKNILEDMNESGCNIIITTLDLSESIQEYGLTHDADKLYKHYIKIYGLTKHLCYDFEIDSSSETVLGEWFYCYSSTLTSDKIRFITQHEFFRALGIENFSSKSTKLNELWANGIVKTPSISVMGYVSEEDKLSEISHQDIKQILELYGSAGFNQTNNLMEKQYSNSHSANNIPSWFHNNAGWWHDGIIADDEFLTGIEFLIKQEIIQIPDDLEYDNSSNDISLPVWFKDNSKWWHDGIIADDEFLSSIEHLIKLGTINVS